MKDMNFDAQFSGSDNAAWEAFNVVVDIFVGKHKAPNYKTLVENMHKTFRNMGCNMTLKLHFLLSHLVPLPQSNRSDICDAHTERLHQDISTMEKWYQESWRPIMLANYCWQLERNSSYIQEESKCKTIQLLCVFW